MQLPEHIVKEAAEIFKDWHGEIVYSYRQYTAEKRTIIQMDLVASLAEAMRAYDWCAEPTPGGGLVAGIIILPPWDGGSVIRVEMNAYCLDDGGPEKVFRQADIEELGVLIRAEEIREEKSDD